MVEASDIIGGVNIGGSLSTLSDVIIWALLILVSLGGAYLIYYLMSFKNVLIVRDAANSKKIIKRFKWKQWKDKNKNVWLITPFKTIKKPLPPYESVETTSKGKMWVEAWRGEDSDTLVYIKDAFDYNTYKETNTGFQPVTTAERELIINEYVKSEAYKKRSGWDIALQFMPWVVPIVLVIIVMMAMGDFTSAVNDIGKPLSNSIATLGEHLETASANIAGIQTAPTQENIKEVPN